MDPILDRLERDWLLAKKKLKYKDLGLVLRICAANCTEDAQGVRNLIKWVDFLEKNINNIPLKDFAKILNDIKYAHAAIGKARTVRGGGNGKFLSGELTPLHRRAAARTLDNRVVANLKNDQLALGDDTDLAFERRLNSLDAE